MANNPTEEPVIDLTDIQGNACPGFRKATQITAGFTILDRIAFGAFLANLRPHVTSSAEVLAYRSALRKSGSAENAIWVNIAFTAAGLRKLVLHHERSDQGAFGQGYHASAQKLGIFNERSNANSSANWLIHDGTTGENACDGIFIIAGDDRNSTQDWMRDLFGRISGAKPAGWDKFLMPGYEVGSALEHRWGEQTAMAEHFGFRDGLATPVIRGRANLGADSWIVQRDPDDPNRPTKHGQELVWPGHLIVGQAKAAEEVNGTPSKLPEFFTGGSFLVFLRLRQDVAGFHRWVDTMSRRSVEQFGGSIDAARSSIAAGVMGRWPSGASLFSSPERDPNAVTDQNIIFPRDGDDPPGSRCPLSAHARKCRPSLDYPNPTPPLFRRGIPYGRPSTSTLAAPVVDPVDRGLHFLAYMSSIEDQYERLVSDFLTFSSAENGAVRDALLGRLDDRDQIEVRHPLGHCEVVSTPRLQTTWVHGTGGLYLFSPALSRIETLYERNGSV